VLILIVLQVPFVLHAVQSGSTAINDVKTTSDARRRYAEIFFDVEKLIEDQSEPFILLMR
jgi:IMP and pyridine-specific 5'-nucleotidase